jgi:hypothetical protein
VLARVEVPGLKYLVGHYIAEALKSPDELQHECTTVHLLEVRYLLKHPQDRTVMTQVLELLEHEQPPLLLASFLTGHGVRLTRSTTIVTVASRQASNADEAQVTVDSRGRVLGGEDLRHGSIGVEAIGEVSIGPSIDEVPIGPPIGEVSIEPSIDEVPIGPPIW